jgi:sugar phosphate isomerase/epimerase
MSACRVSTYAVELSALSADELPGLIAYLGEKPRLPFRYASVHAPVKDRDRDDGETVAVLGELPLWIRSIVTHPDALSDVDAFRALGTRLVLENMDDRKRAGRTTDEMVAFFNALPDAGFCLDVAHARSVDPTMRLAHEMLDRFRSRLRQVHLSSLDDGHHVPLSEGDEEIFGSVLDRCRDVPWILEARPPGRWTDELAARPLVSGQLSQVADQM